VILTVLLSPLAANVRLAGETVKTAVAPLCVMLTVRLIPLQEIVTVAVRDAVVVFSAQIIFSVLLFKPEDAETVAHAALLVTIQAILEVIVTD